jgi:uncharacterized membrane protein YoaK (UPF0700 family)
VSSPARLRMSRTALLPVVILLVCVVPAAVVSPWTTVLFLIPLALAAWVLRVGVDVAADGITVRSLLAQRRVAWTELAGIRVAERGDLWLVTTAGTEVRLPVLRARDLPRLAALSDGRITVPQPPA